MPVVSPEKVERMVAMERRKKQADAQLGCALLIVAGVGYVAGVVSLGVIWLLAVLF
jgi:hypothetical protein